MKRAQDEATRALTARAFTVVEDVVYLGLGVLLAATAPGFVG